MRKSILICSLLLTLAARSAENTSPGTSGVEVVPLAGALAKCRSCAVLLKPGAVVVRLEADSIVVDQTTGSVRLMGSARVKLQDGSELHAGSMIMKVAGNGQQEFHGEGIRTVAAASK